MGFTVVTSLGETAREPYVITYMEYWLVTHLLLWDRGVV